MCFSFICLLPTYLTSAVDQYLCWLCGTHQGKHKVFERSLVHRHGSSLLQTGGDDLAKGGRESSKGGAVCDKFRSWVH
jgi:hypothetical protein